MPQITKPSLLELVVNARVSAALMGLEIFLDRLDAAAFDQHRQDAWTFAEQAGYLYPDQLMPDMLDGEYELGDAWKAGQRRYKEETLPDLPDQVYLNEEEGFLPGWYKCK